MSNTLERRCEDCDGTGLFRLDDSKPEEKCELCDGTGFAATPLGREVLELIRHNLRNILGDVAMTTPDVNSKDQPPYLPQIVAAFRVLHELSVRVTGAGFSVDLEEPGRTIPFDSRSCPSGRVRFHEADQREPT